MIDPLDFRELKNKIDETKTYCYFNNKTFSYKELFSRIDGAIDQLKSFKVVNSVTLCLPPSFDYFAIALACFKIQIPFIPIEETLPINQTIKILHLTNSNLIILQNDSFKNISNLLEKNGISAIVVFEENNWRFVNNAFCYKNELKIPDIAYMIRTSGTSGESKIVKVGRTGLIKYINWFIDAFEVSNKDYFSFLCSTGFDMAINHIFPPFFSLASVIIPTPSEILNLDSLILLLKTRGCTFINTTPSLFENILRRFTTNGLEKEINSLRILMLGGEKVTYQMMKEAKSFFPSTKIVNCYGVAEATVTSFYYEFDENYIAEKNVSIIGKPISELGFQVGMTSRKKSKKIIGELILSGTYVGLGYLGNYQNDKFFFNENGERAYRTGDKVRINKQGDLEYIGRIDRQIKLSGRRVDLNEIEKFLLDRFPNVKKIHLLAHKKDNYEIVLILFYEDLKRKIAISTINQELKKHFSKYVEISEAFGLREIPISKNGKIDEQKLLKEYISAILPASLSSPNKLLNILKSRIPDYNPDKSLFEQGLNSLSFMRLINSLEKMYGINLDISRIITNSIYSNIYETIQSSKDRSIADAQLEKDRSNLSFCKEENNLKTSDNDIVVIEVAALYPGLEGFEAFKTKLENGKLKWGKFRGYSKTNYRGLPLGSFFSRDELYRYFKMYTREEIENIDNQYLLWEYLIRSQLDSLIVKLANNYKIGVFLGMGPSFFQGKEYPNHKKTSMLLAGTTPSMATGRISSLYDLDGPNMVVDTACSSSLTSLYIGYNALLTGDIDVAICGGVQLFQKSLSLELIMIAGIGSSEKDYRPFSSSSGYFPGEGTGAVILTRRDIANDINYSIKASIKNVVMNHDGKMGKQNIPNGARQGLLYDLLVKNKSYKENIIFAELHGTGTPIGDPIEISSIQKFFSDIQNGEKKYLGSSKGFFGHTHYASGITGLLKAIAQIDDKKIYGNPWIKTLNPRIKLSKNSLINIANVEIKAPYFLGMVSSFGYSGTNVSCLLQVENNTNLYYKEKSMGNRNKEPLSYENSNEVINIEKIFYGVIKKYRSDLLDIDIIDKTLIELGFSSLDCLDIGQDLSDKLNFAVEGSELMSSKTVKELCNDINNKILGSNQDIQEKPAIIHLETTENNSITQPSVNNLESLIEYFRETARMFNNSDQKACEELILNQHRIIEKIVSNNKINSGYQDDIFFESEKLFNELKKMISQFLSINDNLILKNDFLEEDLGISSLQKMKLVSKIIKELNLNQGIFDELLTCNSINEIINKILNAK